MPSHSSRGTRCNCQASLQRQSGIKGSQRLTCKKTCRNVSGRRETCQQVAEVSQRCQQSEVHVSLPTPTAEALKGKQFSQGYTAHSSFQHLLVWRSNAPCLESPLPTFPSGSDSNFSAPVEHSLTSPMHGDFFSSSITEWLWSMSVILAIRK